MTDSQHHKSKKNTLQNSELQYSGPQSQSTRQLTRVDRWLAQLDHARLTVSNALPQRRPAPQPHTAPTPQALNHKPHASTIQDIAAYLRIDHTGEVCAQALYLGQASQARTPHLTEHLLYSAEEEEAHLQWCAQRLNELGDKPSRFNLIWYALSFTLGAAIARLGDRISLGFIHATEHQVKRHLQEHIDAIGTHDPHSTAILAEMLEEENQHAAEALKRGGVEFPTWIQSIMWTTSRLMAQVSRRY